ncbi:IS1182 family transposase [Aliikangiella marina]|uniref:IS1182 family transposase n=1 Tax=Aliikangiella marina TaxID=1712262 RepID=A0A545TA62_9GAMM|nr:IS1182 family transposase [Aliikangiella marina]TQV74098.1 IS1182 family transposase [Aliikangiella marina]
MKRFIQGENRSQSTLFPEALDDYISEENQIRVIDAYVDSIDLLSLGFKGVEPKDTGRPSYHPSVMLKLYIYGYLNRLQSSRRLENETHRNVELMWLLSRLTPDFKTIADFRKENGRGIKNVCRQFIDLCRQLNLFSETVIAVDGSRFKAVNRKNRNFTQAKIKSRIERAEASISAYMSALDKADRDAPKDTTTQEKLKDRIQSLKAKIVELNEIDKRRKKSPDGQLSLTDPDSRAMSTKANISGLVGYNVQSAVESKHYLIVAHETTNSGSDRNQLANMAKQARSAMGKESLTVLADKGYYSSLDILAVKELGMKPLVPKIFTSGKRKQGMFTRDEFKYQPKRNEYRCPAGERLPYRHSSFERGMNIHTYYSSNCRTCKLKEKCTTGKERRVRRWEHEEVLEKMDDALKKFPDPMLVRKSTVEHPFGIIKSWMGATHFQMRTLKHVSTEMSLHVLAYNLKRVMKIMGSKTLIEAIKA